MKIVHSTSNLGGIHGIVVVLAVVPFNILFIDWLGRRYTLVIDYLMAGLFFLLIQLCVPRIVETLFMFGVRAFTAGIFNVVYIYTAEVIRKYFLLRQYHFHTIFICHQNN